MSEILDVEAGIAKDICFYSLGGDKDEDQKTAHVSIEVDEGTYLDFMWEGHFLRVPIERVKQLLK